MMVRGSEFLGERLLGCVVPDDARILVVPSGQMGRTWLVRKRVELRGSASYVVAAEAHEVDGRVKFRSIEAEFKLDGDVEPLGEVVALFGVIGVPRAAGPLEEPVDDADDDG